MKMEKVNPREEVLLSLVAIDRNKSTSSKALSDLLLRHRSAKKQDRAFMTRLLEGTLERQLYLDYVLDQFSSKRMEKQKPLIRCLLRMSLYQILFMDQVPDSAACNEAVKLAKKKGFQNLSGFVNGILRGILRGREKIVFPDGKREPLAALSVRCSIPLWILEYWSGQYSYGTVKKMAEASLGNPATSVRVNLSRGTVEEARESLAADGAAVESGRYLPYMLRLGGYDSLDRLCAFREGLIQVQDESSALVAQAAAPPADGLVVDVCAAPGGKSLHLADQMRYKGGRGTVIARDLSEAKLSLIKENVERCRFDNIKTEVFDAARRDDTLVEKADLVVADVPCSGLGVLARKNDIKYRASLEKIRELVLLQRQIVENAAAYVKPGGSLIFSTCTVSVRENEENRDWILTELPFEPEDFSDALPEALKKEAPEYDSVKNNLWKKTQKDGVLALLPGVHGTDGFYIAKFRRIPVL